MRDASAERRKGLSDAALAEEIRAQAHAMLGDIQIEGGRGSFPRRGGASRCAEIVVSRMATGNLSWAEARRRGRSTATAPAGPAAAASRWPRPGPIRFGPGPAVPGCSVTAVALSIILAGSTAGAGRTLQPLTASRSPAEFALARSSASAVVWQDVSGRSTRPFTWCDIQSAHSSGLTFGHGPSCLSGLEYNPTPRLARRWRKRQKRDPRLGTGRPGAAALTVNWRVKDTAGAPRAAPMEESEARKSDSGRVE